MSEKMCYVAADPAQPGAAWGAIVDEPERAKEIGKVVAKWIKEGATVERVDVETAKAMLLRWAPRG